MSLSIEKIANFTSTLPSCGSSINMISLRSMTIEQKQKCFEEQYADIFPYVYKYIRFRISSVHDAEDLVSHIFLNAYEKLGQFDPEKGTLRQWISGVMKHKILDYWRQQQIVLDIQETDGVDMHTIGANQRDVDSSILFRRILDSLPKNLRFLLILHYVDGLNHKEIAEITGKNHAAIRKIFSRLHIQLEQQLLPYKQELL